MMFRPMKWIPAIAVLAAASPATGQQLPPDVPNVCVAPDVVGRNAGGGTSAPYVVVEGSSRADTVGASTDFGNGFERGLTALGSRDSVRLEFEQMIRCLERLDRFLSRLGYELVPVGTTPPDTGGTVPPDSTPAPGPGPGTESVSIISEDSATATLQVVFNGSPSVIGARGGPAGDAIPVCPPFHTPANPQASPATSVCSRRTSAFDVWAVIEEGGQVRTVGPVTVDALPQDTTTNPGPGPGPGPGPSPGVTHPRVVPDTIRPTVVRQVRAHDAAQLWAAINSTQPGDEILLDPGVRYERSGSWMLPGRPAGGWAIIRTDLPYPRGVRIDSTANLAVIACTGPGCEPIRSDATGHLGWRIETLAVEAKHGTNAAIRFHQGGTAVGDRVVVDQVYVYTPNPTDHVTRDVLANATNVAVLRSVLTAGKSTGQDTQGIAAWNTPGPLMIFDSFVTGAAENFIIGGAAMGGPGMVPCDVTIARNHFFKPPEYRALGFVVKNLGELKTGCRVHISGNVFENHWRGAQSGSALNFKTTRSGNEPADWARTEDVHFERNILRNVDMGFNLSYNPNGATNGMRRVVIENNLIERLGPNSDWGDGTSRNFLIQGPHDLVIRKNTSLNPGAHTYLEFTSRPGVNATVEDNLFAGPTTYGLRESAIIAGWTGLTFSGNVVLGTSCAGLPSGWSCSSSAPAGVGADTAAVLAATAGVVR